jgi:chemotaxis receptor (MCP) glutamine deamidase CheD
VSKVGGILHLMLPDSTISPGKALKPPAKFANVGRPQLFRAMGGLKGERSRMRIMVAGGATRLSHFQWKVCTFSSDWVVVTNCPLAMRKFAT